MVQCFPYCFLTLTNRSLCSEFDKLASYDGRDLDIFFEAIRTIGQTVVGSFINEFEADCGIVVP